MAGVLSVPALAAGHHDDHGSHHERHSNHDSRNNRHKENEHQDRLKVIQSRGHVTAPQAAQLSNITLPQGTASSVFSQGAPYTIYTVRLVGPHAHWSGTGSLSIQDNDGTLSTPADLYYLAFQRGDHSPNPFSGDTAPYNATTVGQSSSFSVSFVRGKAQFAVFNAQQGSGPVSITVNDSALNQSKTVFYPDVQTSTTSTGTSGITSNVTAATTEAAGAAQAITFTVTDSTGSPLSGATVTFGVTGSLNASDLSASSATTDSSGQVTVSYTDTHAGDTGTVTATSNGATGATAALTVVAAAPSQIALSPTAAQSLSTASATVDYTLTLEDQYGNAVTGGSDASDQVAVTLTPGAIADGGSLSLSGASPSAADTSASVSITATLSGGIASFTYTAPATLPTGGTGTIAVSDTTNTAISVTSASDSISD